MPSFRKLMRDSCPIAHTNTDNNANGFIHFYITPTLYNPYKFFNFLYIRYSPNK